MASRPRRALSTPWSEGALQTVITRVRPRCGQKQPAPQFRFPPRLASRARSMSPDVNLPWQSHWRSFRCGKTGSKLHGIRILRSSSGDVASALPKRLLEPRPAASTGESLGPLSRDGTDPAGVRVQSQGNVDLECARPDADAAADGSLWTESAPSTAFRPEA